MGMLDLRGSILRSSRSFAQNFLDMIKLQF